MRVRADYSKLRDPLDSTIRLQEKRSLSTVNSFDDFERTENSYNFDVGYNGAGGFDGSVGYEYYHLDLADPDLRQASHRRQNVHAEIGHEVPGWEEQRGFIRWDYWNYSFGKASVHSGPNGSLTENRQLLNDADVNRGVIGVEGPMISDKTLIRAEMGYETWDPQDQAPQGGDRSQFSKWVGAFRMAYRPWDVNERNTVFQLEYQRRVGYSAISNYNAEHFGQFSIKHEWIPKRLDTDFSISYTVTNPSNGPERVLLETGVGATYHLFPQFDVTLKYLYRHETASDEIVTNSAFSRGPALYQYEIRSNGTFYQNIVELGFLLHF
jgi:hypothetical protein